MVARERTPLSIDDFIDFGGYGKPIDNLLEQRLGANEKVILHAEIYRMYFLGKTSPALDLGKMMQDGEPQSGTYSLPSTRWAETKTIEWTDDRHGEDGSNK